MLVHNKGETCADQLKKIRGAIDDAVANDADILKGKRKGLKKDKYEELMSACFTKGTEVFSKDNLKINEIEKGDFVYSYNFEKEKIEEKEVLTIFKSRVDRIIKLTLKNIGTNLIEDIETTLEHLFYTNGNYKLAKYLKVGDELKSFNNETVEIMNVETKKLEKEIFVYNIEVKDNHNYFVGGNKILVHNKKTRYTRTEKLKTDKYGGEIAIGDGKLKLGLPNTDKLTDIVDRKGKIIEYSKLNGGYYICDYSDGLGSFSDHSIAIYTTDTSKFKGNTRDFWVFDEDIQKANPDRFSSRAEVEDYRNKNGLTLHHEDDGFDVIDYVLHKYFSHDGEASVQRKN